jgi:hypothetical protein
MLIGKPRSVAIVPQMAILSTAAPTTGNPIAAGSTIPLPIVEATAVPVTTAPRRLRAVAIARARNGERTLVQITVAIAFGASFQPLTNSAASTISRTKTSGQLGSGRLKSNPFQFFAYPF